MPFSNLLVAGKSPAPPHLKEAWSEPAGNVVKLFGEQAA